MSEVHQDFIGLYQGNFKAETLAEAIENVLMRHLIPSENALSQCYDGTGIKSGTATQTLKKSPKAFLIHSLSHALNLSVADMMRHIPFLDNFMSTTLGTSNFVKISPKRYAT